MASTDCGCWSCWPLRRRTRHPENESARGVSRKTRQIFVKVRMPQPPSSRSAGGGGGEKKPCPDDSDMAPSNAGALENRTSMDEGDEAKGKAEVDEPDAGAAAVAVKIRKTSFFGMFRRPVGEAESVVHVPFGETCVICMEKFKPNEVLEVLLCQHLYHERCIKRWLGDHTSCCVCKADMEEMAKAVRKREPARRRSRRARSRSETRSERSASFGSESGYASDQARSAFSSMSAPAALAGRTLPPDSSGGGRPLAGATRVGGGSSSTPTAAPPLQTRNSNSNSNSNSTGTSVRSGRTLPFPRYNSSTSGGGRGRGRGRWRGGDGDGAALDFGPWSLNTPAQAPASASRPLVPTSPAPPAAAVAAAAAVEASARPRSVPSRAAGGAAGGTGISALTALGGKATTSPGSLGSGGRRPMLRLSLSAFPPPEWGVPIGGGDSEERSSSISSSRSSSSSSSSCGSISSINSDGDEDHNYFTRAAHSVSFEEEKPRGQSPLRRPSSSPSSSRKPLGVGPPGLRSPRVVHTPRSGSPQPSHVLARSPRWRSHSGASPATAPSPRRAAAAAAAGPPRLPSTPRPRGSGGEFPSGVASLSTPQRAERRRRSPRPPSPFAGERPLSSGLSGQAKAEMTSTAAAAAARRRWTPSTPRRVRPPEALAAVLTPVPTSARSTPGRRCRQQGFADREMRAVVWGRLGVAAGKGKGDGGGGGGGSGRGRGEGKRRVVWGEGKLTAEEESRCGSGNAGTTAGNGNRPQEDGASGGGADQQPAQQPRREGASTVGTGRPTSGSPPSPPPLPTPPTPPTPHNAQLPGESDRKPEELSLLPAGKLYGWTGSNASEEDWLEDFEKASTSERGSHKTCSTQWSELESTLSGASSGYSMVRAGEDSGGSSGAGARPLRRRTSSPAEVLPTSPRHRQPQPHPHHHHHRAPAVAEEKLAPSLAITVPPVATDGEDEGRRIQPWETPRGVVGVDGASTPTALTPGARTPGALRDRSESAPMIWD